MRSLLRMLAIIATLAGTLAASASTPPRPTPATPVSVPGASVETVGMTVSNMERALAFYTQALPFQLDYDVEVAGRPWEQLHGVFGARMRIVGLHLGDERLELTEYLTPKGRPFPPDSRGNDRWFQHVAIIVRDMDRAYAHLRSRGIAHASTEPQRLPDWNPLRITTLRAAQGTGVELLEYRAPRDGRPTPIDLKANDLAHWQITMRGTSIDRLLQPSKLFALVSADVTAIDQAPLGFSRGLLVRDPDGHAVRLVEP